MKLIEVFTQRVSQVDECLLYSRVFHAAFRLLDFNKKALLVGAVFSLGYLPEI